MRNFVNACRKNNELGRDFKAENEITVQRIYELKRKYDIPFKGKEDERDVINIDFSYLDLEGVDFSGIHPKFITYYGCILDNCNF